MTDLAKKYARKRVAYRGEGLPGSERLQGDIKAWKRKKRQQKIVGNWLKDNPTGHGSTLS